MNSEANQDPRGLFSPETITWKIHSDPAMAVGGIRALLQQALHPIAMDGVAKNSNFREDAWGRLESDSGSLAPPTGQPDADRLQHRIQRPLFRRKEGDVQGLQ